MRTAALAIRQRLTDANTAAYEPQFAESLSNYGTALALVGRHEEALAASAKALDIFRRLTEANPSVYEPRLALTLAAFAKVSLDGRRNLGAALSATAEALDIYYGLAMQNPSVVAAFAPYFTVVLGLHADLLHALGRRAEADAFRGLCAGDISEFLRMMFSRGRR